MNQKTPDPEENSPAAWYRLQCEGMTTAEIAVHASRLAGRPITRNSVVGALNRYKAKLGLKSPPRSNVYRLKPEKQKSDRPPAPPRDFKPSLTLPSFQDVLIDNTCRYIAGDPKNPDGPEGPPVFCGHDKKRGSSFCEGHHAVCYQRINHQRRKTMEGLALDPWPTTAGNKSGGWT